MMTTLSILSRDQGKLNNRPATEEAWFARFGPKTPPIEVRAGWFNLRHLWPLLRRMSSQRQG